MPGSEHHNRSITENKNILNDIDKKTISHNYYGWRIVIIFYTALHMVEKHLYRRSRRNTYKHIDREKLIRNDPSYKNFLSEYKTLQNQSERARYNCVNLTENDFNQAIECLDKIKSELYN